MPEALERWPVQLLERLLPRHLGLIYEINDHVLSGLRARPDAADPHLADVSIIDEGHARFVRMGHLAFLGARKVNGVSALHGELMKRTVFRALHHHFPDRITAVTNGVTPRRWLLECNPGLAGLITGSLGDARWVADLERLDGLAPLADDPGFRARFAGVKRANKVRLAAFVRRRRDLSLDPAALFDVQIKRIHEYKRQLLNILDAVATLTDLRDGAAPDGPPRVKILAGKAAPSYWRAKLIIKLANDLARALEAEPLARDRLRLVFLDNYNVSLAELVIPAADLSEQISTAGMEASGTGNMKFALNGAVTIGTLDGANVEIRDRVGPDNILVFGLTAEEVLRRRREGSGSEAAIAASPRLARALQLLERGGLSPDDPGRFRPIVEDLRRSDHFLVCSDFDAYAEAQQDAARLFADPGAWWRCAALNTARTGWFSSDRTIRDYAREIWRVPLEA
jgi:starch phosphorylase